jgi:hypothetical protein
MKKKKSTKKAPEGFPRELLKQPKERWLEYFKSYGVEHTVFREAYSKLMKVVLGNSSKMLVFIIGPTGAGKTFLRECMEDQLSAMADEDANWNPSRIPFINVEVPGKDTIRHSWADLYVRQLRALYEPESFIGKKIIHGDLALKFDVRGHLTFDSRASTRKYRYALEQALNYRDPIVVSFEEAQHLLDFGGLSFQEQTDCVKSIANMTKKRYALFGNYDMQSLLDQSDQLMRRSVIIHLRSYGDSTADQNDFRSTIYHFQLNMPFRETPDLLKHYDYLSERTASCVGILADWLSDAYTQAISEPTATTLELKHLEDNVPLSRERAFKLRKRIVEDEKKFLQEFADEAEEGIHSDEDGGESAGEASNKEHPSRAKHRNRKAGERAPERDDNGMNKRDAA